jgi:DNA-binding SARP family transcriptional activator
MDLKNINAIEAPGGYGKTHYIEQIWAEFQGIKIKYEFNKNNPESFFENLRQLCKEQNISGPEFNDPLSWYKAWNNEKKSFLFVVDDFHSNNFGQEIIRFWSYFFKNILSNKYFIFASRNKTNLPVQYAIMADKGAYLDKTKLKFTVLGMRKLFLEQNLDWNDQALKFYNYCYGWPAAVKIFMEYKKGNLDEAVFNYLLANSVTDLFSPVCNDISGIFNPALQENLEAYFLELDSWAPLWKDKIFETSRSFPEYWLHKASHESNRLSVTKIYLDRALNLIEINERAGENRDDLMLQVLNKIALTLSLFGKFKEARVTIMQAEKYFGLGSKEEQVFYLYLKAHLLRNICKYPEAILLSGEILSFKCDTKNCLEIQNLTRELLGLIEFQKGNYEKAKIYINNVLAFSQADKNEAMILRIRLILELIEICEGKPMSSRPVKYIKLIEKHPSVFQPDMFLYLEQCCTFAEKIEPENTGEIIKKLENIENNLEWHFLRPLILNIEARIKRLNREYDKAINYHKQALELLEDNSFDYLQVSLDLGITILREGNKDKAISVLEDTFSKAGKTGAAGICRKINLILECIRKADEPKTIVNVLPKPSQLPVLSVKMFGGFQAEIGGRVINKWPRKKAKNLLIYLLLNPSGIHREILADLLSSSEDPLKVLDVNIHCLRKIFEPAKKSRESSFIIFRDSCYFFNWDYPLHWDVKNFNTLYQEWKGLEKDNNNKSAALAREILFLYQGPLLPEPEFKNEWITERGMFKKKAKEILRALILNILKNDVPSMNQLAEAEERCEKFIETDPYDEYGYYLYLELARIKKDKHLAKEIYQRMLTIFSGEFDLLPSPEVQKIYSEIFS